MVPNWTNRRTSLEHPSAFGRHGTLCFQPQQLKIFWVPMFCHSHAPLMLLDDLIHTNLSSSAASDTSSSTELYIKNVHLHATVTYICIYSVRVTLLPWGRTGKTTLLACIQHTANKKSYPINFLEKNIRKTRICFIIFDILTKGQGWKQIVWTVSWSCVLNEMNELDRVRVPGC